MKFLCLAYEQEQSLNALTRSEWEALRSETLTYVDQLRRSGRLVVTAALESVRTATTVRVRDGKRSTTDGPFAETKEQLLGLYVVDAASQDEAVGMARDLRKANPTAVYEIRPILLYLPGAPFPITEAPAA